MQTLLTEQALAYLISSMEWGEDENFKETPKRVVKWLKQYQGLSKEECWSKSVEDLSKSFPSDNKNLIAQGPVRVYSMCPHHLLPIEYDVWIGYIPNRKTVGLSKLSRVAQNFARYPFIQEDYTEQVALCLSKGLKAKGVMIVVKGLHNCMRMRGVKQQEAKTTTSAIKGVFEDPPKGKDPRSEFLKVIGI